MSLSEMALGKGHTRTRLQISLEGDSATLVCELDENVDMPRATAGRVVAPTSVMSF
jgi:hypothetical protein